MIVTISYEDKSYDIMTNPDSSIGQTIKILKEKGMLEVMDTEQIAEVYSVRRKRRIRIETTYRESGIYQGDILKIK